MAHIVVYLQRTPLGIHPASAVALCAARDIGSERGATVTAVCLGDAGTFDQGIVADAARFGADLVLFCGPTGLSRLHTRLAPVHVLVPWTPEGIEATQSIAGGPPVPRWIRQRGKQGLDAISGIIAGILPWHDLSTSIEPDYEKDADQVPTAPWTQSDPVNTVSSNFAFGPRDTLVYLAHSEVTPTTVERLRRLSAAPVEALPTPETATQTCLVVGPGAGPALEGVGHHPRVRVVLLPGGQSRLDASWSHADWVFEGPPDDVLDRLVDGPWLAASG